MERLVRRLVIGAGVSLALMMSVAARASCTCQCVDGQMQALCSSALDIRPICPSRICPIAGPSIAPINPPTIPPLGTSSCRQAQVCDPFGNCRWQQVCQ
jgi:hypothetical protein